MGFHDAALSRLVSLLLPLIARWSLPLSVAPRSAFQLAPPSPGVPSRVPAGANLLLVCVSSCVLRGLEGLA